MMRGQIWVESEEGSGSTFHFTVRLLIADHREQMPHGVDRSEGSEFNVSRDLRILVVEDNPVNRMLATRLIEKHGFTPLAAANGRSALEVLEQERVDCVLMDVQMPEMDGFEATASIREREHRSGRHLAIIAMTAHAMAGDRERCLEAGMDDYVVKPIDVNELLAAVGRVLPESVNSLGLEMNRASHAVDARAI